MPRRLILSCTERPGDVAIEVKRAAKIRTKELRSLKTFAKDYPMASLYIGGETTIYIDDINLN